jgi:hypothetical protein
MLKIIASMMAAAIVIVYGGQAVAADYLAGDFQKAAVTPQQWQQRAAGRFG